MAGNEAFMEIGGIRLRYVDAGEGAPILFLHGWGGCIESFAPAIARFVNTNRVVALDFPGHGQSGEPPLPWSVTEYCELLMGFMRERQIGRCDIVAHSFGGRVAVLLAASHPELIHRMVLTGCAGIPPKRGMAYYFRVYSYKALKALGRVGAINRLLRIDERKKNAGSPDYRALSDGMKATFVRVVNQNLRPCLKHIAAPTLLIWGSEDQDTPLYMGRIMEEEIPGSALIVFEGAGHFAYLEEPERFLAILSSFFGGD